MGARVTGPACLRESRGGLGAGGPCAGSGSGRGAAEAQMRDQAGPGMSGNEQGLWHQELVTQCRRVQHLCKWFVLRTAL